VPGLGGLRAATLVACAMALGGCLGGGSDGPAAVSGGAAIGGSVRSADCDGWRKAGPSIRHTTITDIKAFAGGPVGSGDREGATLPDDKAYALFEATCKAPYARRFKLYKLYTRAASFQSRTPPGQ
jgi:hypothetical protein